MRLMEYGRVISLIMAFNKKATSPDGSVCDLALRIISMSPYVPNEPKCGTSTFAKKRRAKAIGRCHRCYRVAPGFYFTKNCDGYTCKPPISVNSEVRDYILLGKRRLLEAIEAQGYGLKSNLVKKELGIE
ncbi:putative nucleic acid binding protein [Helleborus mosaic virus]|uniref:RNA silencing suppressor n=1 Tax=Helleborus mosaic virus TaxID=592207 RepID=B9UZ46_9VIRU|nr:putative nucleic acid binding protein [Helleborus mosaic virus]ACM46002.1 putative nucleic acid binding protein [Helleborus mosaic virus]WPR15565.1 nucleic acid binding protein [Helleborus mosaic virus]